MRSEFFSFENQTITPTSMCQSAQHTLLFNLYIFRVEVCVLMMYLQIYTYANNMHLHKLIVLHKHSQLRLANLMSYYIVYRVDSQVGQHSGRAL